MIFISLLKGVGEGSGGGGLGRGVAVVSGRSASIHTGRLYP